MLEGRKGGRCSGWFGNAARTCLVVGFGCKMVCADIQLGRVWEFIEG